MGRLSVAQRWPARQPRPSRASTPGTPLTSGSGRIEAACFRWALGVMHGKHRCGMTHRYGTSDVAFWQYPPPPVRWLRVLFVDGVSLEGPCFEDRHNYSR